MNRVLQAARLHLINPLVMLSVPWLVVGISFAINVAVWALTPAGEDDGGFSGGILALYITVLVVYLLVIIVFIPFAFYKDIVLATSGGGNRDVVMDVEYVKKGRLLHKFPHSKVRRKEREKQGKGKEIHTPTSNCTHLHSLPTNSPPPPAIFSSFCLTLISIPLLPFAEPGGGMRLLRLHW